MRLHGAWVSALSRGAAFDARGSTGKPEPAFQSAERELLRAALPNSGADRVLGLIWVLGGILVHVLG